MNLNQTEQNGIDYNKIYRNRNKLNRRNENCIKSIKTRYLTLCGRKWNRNMWNKMELNRIRNGLNRN